MVQFYSLSMFGFISFAGGSGDIATMAETFGRAVRQKQENSSSPSEGGKG